MISTFLVLPMEVMLTDKTSTSYTGLFLCKLKLLGNEVDKRQQTPPYMK